jgi:hypothetical protein
MKKMMGQMPEDAAVSGFLFGGLLVSICTQDCCVY